MARKPLSKSNPVNDVEAKLSADFNQLIKKIHKQLSTKKRSPVYTGFFASSWKVQTMGVKAVDKVEDFQPWASIKKAKKDSWNKDSVKSKNTTYKIQPRFPVDKTFNFRSYLFNLLRTLLFEALTSILSRILTCILFSSWIEKLESGRTGLTGRHAILIVVLQIFENDFIVDSLENVFNLAQNFFM